MSYPLTFPRSIGVGPSSAIISLMMMISSFSMISSNFLGPVKNSRLMSFNDHAVSLSFYSFASLHFLCVASLGCSAIAGSFDDLGADDSAPFE